jgi:hypothetical protein
MICTSCRDLTLNALFKYYCSYFGVAATIHSTSLGGIIPPMYSMETIIHVLT